MAFFNCRRSNIVILVAVVVALLSIVNVEGLDCYSCANCNKNYEDHLVTCSSDQAYCATIATIYIDYLIMTRSCAEECVEAESSVIKISCCSTAGCNNAHGIAASWLTFVIPSSVFFFTMMKTTY